MPRLWVHPDSWQPIDFDDYLANAQLIDSESGKALRASPNAASLANLTFEQQCGVYLQADPVPASQPAPVYVQAYRDESPASPEANWTYIKYNWVFDWSGLAAELNALSSMGAWLTGGDLARWHRLDIHISAVLAFDRKNRLKLLTLAQHNHQQTFLAGRDFDADRTLNLAAAVRSNEVYLDDGSSKSYHRRVVPFFNDVAYLIDANQKPRFYASDLVYGRNAGAVEIKLRPVFIAPGHPLTDFAGLLGPPRKFFGRYIGRDGPPGMHYYAPPAYIPLVNFAAMGFWHSGDMDLLVQLESMLGNKEDFRSIDWEAMVNLMRMRLTTALSDQDK